jgi:hypothetical protein
LRPFTTGAKKSDASSASLRKYSKALPRNWLVPDLVVAITTPPADPPYSAA